MATGRKGPSVPAPRKRLSSPPESGGADDADDGGSALAGPAPDDLVAVVRGLAAAVADHGLTELIVDTPDVTFTLRRGGTSMPVTTMHSLAPMNAMNGMDGMGQMGSMPSMQIPTMHHHSMGSITIPTIPHGPAGAQPSGILQVPPVAPAVEEKVHIVTSPFVGTFYRRPNPDAAEYVKINDRINKGQVLCLVEAMKLMNEIESDLAGTVVGVLAEDGAPVEYGQPHFRIA